MTRKHVNAAIREALEDKGLPCNPEQKEVIDLAVDAALEYVLSFAQEVSQELVSVGLYTEGMVAGVFVRKLKGLINATK